MTERGDAAFSHIAEAPHTLVIPAKAGIHFWARYKQMDSGFRRHDGTRRRGLLSHRRNASHTRHPGEGRDPVPRRCATKSLDPGFRRRRRKF